MIQKLAIQYNLAGSAENNTDGSVQFTLQGDNDRIKQAVKAISKGTKKSSNVNVEYIFCRGFPRFKNFHGRGLDIR